MKTLFLVLFLVGCASTPNGEYIKSIEGPLATTQIRTPYDDLMDCTRASYLGKQVSIGIGDINDGTGKICIGANCSGKYVPQTAGDMLQTIAKDIGLFKVYNRRDPRVMDMEARHGRKLEWGFTDYYITGSITGLDFQPGEGFELDVYGVRVKRKQHRMNVMIDLALTNTLTSEVISVVSIHKQIVASEMGGGITRFFGSTFIAIDLGKQSREGVHFGIRQMLKFGVVKIANDVYSLDEKQCSKVLQGLERVNPRVSKKVESP